MTDSIWAVVMTAAVAVATGGTATEAVELRHLWRRSFQEIKRDNMKQMSTRWTHANTNNGKSVCEIKREKESENAHRQIWNNTRTWHRTITPRKWFWNTRVPGFPRTLLCNWSGKFPVRRVQEPYRGRARFVQKLTFYMVPRPKIMFFMQNFKGFPMP